MLTKILFSIYQTANHSNGGVNSMTQILEEDRSVDPIIMTNRLGPFNTRWEQRGWPIFNSNIKWGDKDARQSKLAKVGDLIRSNYLALKIIKKNALKILYCNDIQGFWCSYYGGKLTGIKIIFNLRDTKSSSELASLKKWSFIAGHADIVIVLSEEMKDFVVSKLLNGQHSKKVFVTYSIVNQQRFFPVDTKKRKQGRVNANLEAEDFVISYVAAFNEKKAQLPFITQLITKFKDQPNIKFCFIGDFLPDSNLYADACRQAVEELGLQSMVRFVGHDSRIDEWYKLSDLVAIASIKEGLARCMIEAISCGTPVVSFDVCSANEILNGYNCGEVAAMGNYDEFFTKILKIKNDTQLWRTYSFNGVKVADKLFAKDKVLEKYKEIYDIIA